jgi:hypothetical protein
VLDEALMAARFLRDLPGFLRNPVIIQEARAALDRRFERREEDFVELLGRTIYGHARSPYRALLRHAGCELGDAARLVREEGVDGALGILLRRGVYLTVNEFKGRAPLRRGSATITVDAGSRRNPTSAYHGLGASSGSRGRPTVIPWDLRFVRDLAVTVCVAFHARHALDWVYSRWSEPGQLGLHLGYAGFGMRTERWFSPVDPADPALHGRYRWSGRALKWGSRLAGKPFRAPEFVSPEAPEKILDWIADVLRAGREPFLVSYASHLVRLAQVAHRGARDLTGAHFLAIGEPLTAARATAIRHSGAEVTPAYGSMGVGFMALGCTAPEASDDVHLLHDRVAVLGAQEADGVPGIPPGALLISSLRPSAPMILLNVSLGDHGTLTDRPCGCPLAGAGWPRHLHGIRSFEKLTAGGMSFLDADLVRVLEDVLPTRFGGVPSDYQLVEGESEDGTPVVRLLVHPGVGALDEPAVIESFLQAIGGGSGPDRVMSTMWRSRRMVRVERRPPVKTGSGKVLHLHVERKADSGASV